MKTLVNNENVVDYERMGLIIGSIITFSGGVIAALINQNIWSMIPGLLLTYLCQILFLVCCKKIGGYTWRWAISTFVNLNKFQLLGYMLVALSPLHLITAIWRRK